MLDHASSQDGMIGVDGAQGRRLGRFLDAMARWAVYLSAVLVPIAYLPFTVDGLELTKQLVLIVLAAAATLGWLGRMLVECKVMFRRTPMNLLVGVYLVVYALSAWFSKSRYGSFVGDFGQEKAGLVTVACFALLFFVGLNTLRGAKDVKNVMVLAVLGGFITIALGFLQAMGLRIVPGGVAQSGSFNLIGTSNALGIYAGFILALLMGIFLSPEEGKMSFAKRAVMGVLGVLAALYIASVSFWVLWIVVIAASVALVFYGMLRTDKVKRITMLSIPMAVIVIGVVFTFVRFPITFGAPIEVMPSLKASWNIGRQSLTAHPLFGSGPGMFLYDYSQFHQKDLNQTQFWNVHFDRSSSRLLTMLATTGIIGFVAFAVMIGYLFLVTVTRLWKGSDDWALTLTLFAGWVALGFGKAFYSSNMALESLFWTVTMLLAILEWHQWHEAKFDNSPRASLMLSFFFIVAVIFSVSGLYLEGQRYAGELAYATGLNRNAQKVEDVDASIKDFLRANALNGQNDLYLRTLSQAYTLRTNIEVQKVGAKPTDEDSRRVATLAANAINAGKQATAVNPFNVQNWASLANLYLDLVGSTEGAGDAAIAAYQKAIDLEPNNPTSFVGLGRVYLALADAAKPGTQDKDEAMKQKAQKEVNDDLAKAEENLNKSIALKDDQADAHYWLATVYQRQGKTKEAIAKLQKVLALNPQDLNVGFQLALLYYQNGEKDKAIKLLEQVTALSPQYSNAQWYLAVMYEKSSPARLDDAIARVQIVLKNNPGSEDAKKFLEALNAEKNGSASSTGTALPTPPTTPSDTQVIDTTPPAAPAPAPKPTTKKK